MPIYEYLCDKCHHEFEEIVFGSQNPICPDCGSTQTHKLMSRPCCHVNGDGGADGAYAPAPTGGGGGGCAGCTGGNCASCH